ncbi:MAG: GFA family protein [Alphaproteobacteria bacterium]|nr:GFA family protein [Alphaproteobacteria bacterium]
MRLEGSCHCRAVRFTLNSSTLYPYQLCYCSICCKTAGGGGYAINIMGAFDTLKLVGRKHLKVYRVRLGGRRLSTAHRNFCGRCGSALWVWDPSWPELIHPFASAIDTPLPMAPERVHLMLNYAAPWVPVPKGRKEAHFDEYPALSIEDWHKKRGLYEDDARRVSAAGSGARRSARR